MAQFAHPIVLGAPFCAELLRKWRSPGVAGALRSRGVTLETATLAADAGNDVFEARQRNDVAKHGLRGCALPSCTKKETTVKELAHCSVCRFVVYCCAAHQAVDWDRHKHACEPPEVEQQWRCALASCACAEPSSGVFKMCSGCQSVAYCCLEHQAADWKAHKKVCREKQGTGK